MANQGLSWLCRQEIDGEMTPRPVFVGKGGSYLFVSVSGVVSLDFSFFSAH